MKPQYKTLMTKLSYAIKQMDRGGSQDIRIVIEMYVESAGDDFTLENFLW